MQFLVAAGQLLKLINKLVSLFMEKDAEKSRDKELEMNRLTNAAKETDPKKRASKLNRVLDNTRGM
jgi:hypothetical protein